MRRYIQLIRLFLQNSLMVEMEYRVNFIGLFLLSLMDAVWSVGGAVLFYSHRASIGGWSFHETLVVIGIYFIAYGFLDVVLRPNIDDLFDHVRTGSLDFLLIKPLNVQVHATLRRYRFQKLSNVLIGIALIVYALIQLHHTPDAGQLILFVVLCLGGGVLLYAAMVAVGTLAFWMVDNNNVDETIGGFLETGRYPADAFPEPLRGLISFVVPIAFITTVPAEVILGKITPQFVLYGWCVAAVLLIASLWLWQAALRHYNSASS